MPSAADDKADQIIHGEILIHYRKFDQVDPLNKNIILSSQKKYNNLIGTLCS